jgi:hypothetical protein
MAATRNRRRNRNGRFTRSRARPRSRAMNAAPYRRRRRVYARRRNPMRAAAAVPNHRRRRRNYTKIIANPRRRYYRRRHRNPGAGNVLKGAAFVGAGMALTQFAMNYVPSINIGGAIGTFVEQGLVAYLIGWAAKKTRLVNPADADLMVYGGLGSVVMNILDTYVFAKLPTLFQASGTGASVAVAAATGAAIQSGAAQPAAAAPSASGVQDSYWNNPAGMNDLVALPNRLYDSSYYGSGSGMGALVGWRGRR